MQPYRFLGHSGDAFFEAYGFSFEELLENSAKAMCSVMYELKAVEARQAVEIGVEGENKEELLHNFLESVLFEIEMRGMLFSKFKVTAVESAFESVRGRLFGEKLDASRHKLKTEIKAVTWHKFLVQREGNKWISRVLVDI